MKVVSRRLLSYVSLKKLNHIRQRFNRKLVSIRMNVCHKLGTANTQLDPKQTCNFRLRRISLQELPREANAVLLSLKRNQRIFLTGDNEHRFWRRVADQPSTR